MSHILAVLETLRSSVEEESGEVEEVEIPEDKLGKVYELWIKKVPVANIAKSFKVSAATIYRWIDKYKEKFDEAITTKPRSELLLDSIRFMRVVRDSAMSEVQAIDSRSVKVLPGGTIRSVAPESHELKAKHAFLKIALDAEEGTFAMFQKTGVLPNAVKEIHYSLKESRPVGPEVKNITMSREDIVKNIEQLVTNGRSMPQVADDLILQENVA